MAASMGFRASGKMSYVKIAQILKPSLCISVNNNLRYCSGASPDIEQIFIRPDTQKLLRDITGFDMNVVYKTRFADIKTPKYQLLTNEELEQVQQKAIRKASSRLVMPPVMNARSQKEEVLSHDGDITGHDDHPYVFTDITYGVADKDRLIVVREPDGKLRHAGGDERDRLLHAYFPREGRMHRMPTMFEENQLEKVLQAERYVYVLDRACIQFEPDDHNFVRVSRCVYEHVADNEKFEALYSTRHYGPLALYLVWVNKCEGLIADKIRRNRLKDAAKIINLHNLIYPSTESSKLSQLCQKSNKSLPIQEYIQTFAEKDSKHGEMIMLSLQAYRELENTEEATG